MHGQQNVKITGSALFVRYAHCLFRDMFVDETSYEILSARRIFRIYALKEYLHSCIEPRNAHL